MYLLVLTFVASRVCLLPLILLGGVDFVRHLLDGRVKVLPFQIFDIRTAKHLFKGLTTFRGNPNCYSPTIVGLIISKQPVYGDRSDGGYEITVSTVV